MCGGTLTAAPQQLVAPGLSPRVRGNPLNCCSNFSIRSIPACAGEPSTFWSGPGPHWVYPRACGGTTEPRSRPLLGGGLSPRVRGNPCGWRPTVARAGSIPACAGEPHEGLSGVATGGVYPRVCGGTASPFCPMRWIRGLSPRVRGNRESVPNPRSTRRSIPACAGEPRRLSARCGGSAVYPRVCGGTSETLAYALDINGLSPRVRGNLPFPHRRQDGGRSIPACAGEPSVSSSPCTRRRVYPRVCGGTG